MRKRIISAFLCFALFVSCIPQMVLSVFSVEPTVTVTHEGQPAEQIIIPSTEKRTVTAVFDGGFGASYQWQILLSHESNVWVDILDKTGVECELSSAVVNSLVDESGSAYIRCEVDSRGSVFYSDPLCVTVDWTAESAPAVPEIPELARSFDLRGEAGLFTLSRLRLNRGDALATAEGEGEDLVTVTVMYLDYNAWINSETESSIYTSYVATVERGSAFHQTVQSPAYLGFAPFYDPEGNDTADSVTASAATVPLNYDSVTEDIVVRVFYKPVKVPYAIRYFFQDIHDDLYTENPSYFFRGEEETGTIITDEAIAKPLEDRNVDLSGFQKLYHWPEAVAADGSTVFECYYDRNYYLIQFKLEGGYGVDPIYARFGTPYVVNDPVRPGYEFQGWDLATTDTTGDGRPDTGDGEVDYLPGTIPAEGRTYIAMWRTVETTFTVAYWLQDPEDAEKYNYITSAEFPEESGTPVNAVNYYASTDNYQPIWNEIKEALENDQDAAHIYYDAVKTAEAGDVTVNGDGSTVVNVFYNRQEFTLRFYYAAEITWGTTTIYKVVGGTSWPFGRYGNSGQYRDSELSLLDNHYASYNNQWGTVSVKPTLNQRGEERNYKTGSTESATNSGVEYLYIEFKALYGADISELWPCDVFAPATRTSSGWNGSFGPDTPAYVSAWNGEYNVWYSGHGPTRPDGEVNQTIKGNYEKLDYQILFEEGYTCADNTVCYLCFWENGAAVGWSVPELYQYHIWVQGEPPDAETETGTYLGSNYWLYEEYATYDDSDIGQQTAVALDGYRYVGRSYNVRSHGSEVAEAYDVHFYYEPIDYDLKFYNHDGYIYSDNTEDENGDGVHWGYNFPLPDGFIPPYPHDLEEGAYYFAGWYADPLCRGNRFGDFVTDANGNQTGYTFDNAAMPADNLTLYAKWEKLHHSVYFFETYDDMLAFRAGDQTITPLFHSPYDVLHGELLGHGDEIQNPTREENGMALTFSGWFYMDNGAKKAFTYLDMVVNEDLYLFADWSSQTAQPYRVSYVLQEDPTVHVAPDTVGYAYYGTTRTFTAKAGEPYDQLYDAYNNGYFPTVSSHSITVQYEPDPNNPVYNNHTFYYVQARNITYTVRYVNSMTGVELGREEKTTNQAVVTERYQAFPDMVPDAFYKRLVLEVKQDEHGNWVGTDNNVITFYYTPNQTSAYYAVHHMLQTLESVGKPELNYAIDGSGDFVESGTHIEGVGTIGTQESITPQEIAGFRVLGDKGWACHNDSAHPDHNISLTNGNYEIWVRESGTELYIFYARESYDYTVYYREYGNDDPNTNNLAPQKSGSAAYGSTVTENAVTIPGYTCVSAEIQSITIREDGEQNVIIFYYAPTQYTVEYQMVADDGGTPGSLSQTIEIISGTDPAVGSVPTANSYYDFEGWYTDAACTNSVPESWVDGNNRLTPAGLSATERNIFYAKFVRRTRNLTIHRDNAEDAEQVFVYEIRNVDTGKVIRVTVVGEDDVTIHDLPCGNYTVTQADDWAWRYGETSESVDLVKGVDEYVVQFQAAAGTHLWLDGHSQLVENIYGGTDG